MSVTEWAIAAAVLGLVWALLCVALHTLDLLPLPMFGKKWNPKGLVSSDVLFPFLLG
jgi:hypothetical protein